MKKSLALLLFTITIASCILYAHSGRTDSKGGHCDRKTGEYHYHNSGRPVPLHKTPPPKPATSITENHWQVAINNKHFKGQLEAPVSTGRIDILTDEFAIEVDKVSKYQEGIQQALKYAKATSKEPVLAIYIDGHKNGYELLLKADKLCKEKGVKLVLVNSYVSVNDLIALTQISSTANIELSYWLNTNSDVRHNKACRYYKNTSKGRKCSKSEGKACNICGG